MTFNRSLSPKLAYQVFVSVVTVPMFSLSRLRVPSQYLSKAFMRVEIAGEEGFLRQHDPIVDRLGMQRAGEECDQRQG